MAVITDAIMTILYTALDVLPIVLFIFGFQTLILRKPLPHFKRLLAGLGFVILGLGLFLIGLEMALFPLGREMAAQLTSGMAHDFSNLLTIILGMQSRLARLPQDPQAEPLIAATLAAARRGGQLLGRIADITGPRAWQPEPVHMQVFLDDLEIEYVQILAVSLRVESVSSSSRKR